MTLEFQRRGRRTDSSAVLYAAARCAHGCPQVIVSSPLSADGRPFPTVFWLTCPYLGRRCGELESAQKISELERIFSERSAEVAAYHRSYAALRMKLLSCAEMAALAQMSERKRSVIENSGVGGIDWQGPSSGAKCLHLQTAAWLGMGFHPASDWLCTVIGPLSCAEGLCLLA